MRIAVVRKECTVSKGGAERYCANLCRTLSENGHQVYLIAQKCDPDIYPYLIHIPIRVNSFSSSTKNRSFHVNSQKALQRLNVDRVYALSRTYPADAFRLSDPLHRYWMDLRYPRWWKNWLQILSLRHRTLLSLEKHIFQPTNTKLIITNSRLAKQQVTDLYAFPADRIQVIYNGVDLHQFRPAPVESPRDDPDTIELLFVAMDFKRKGLAEIIKALAQLKQKSIHCCLKVVGQDTSRPYKTLAGQLGVGDLLEFKGPSKTVETHYRQADLLIFPTYYDPFANVCLEALACGLPVVTTPTNGAAEIIEEGQTGFILNGPQTLSQQITAKIAQFSRLSPADRRAMAKQARKTAEKFTLENHVHHTIKQLSQL